MPPSGDALTLSREELYELVWSKPLTELAKDLGLSDVGLAKRCRKLGVPVPGRGYWARVAAGQEPHRPQLRKRKQDAEQAYWDQVNLTFASPRDEPQTAPRDDAPWSALREKIEASPANLAPDLRHASAAVKRTALHLKRPWRDEIVWNPGERKGPIVAIDISDELADRALLLAERVIAAANLVGWQFKKSPDADGETHPPRHRANRPPPPPSGGSLLVEGELIALRIDESRRRIDHVETAAEKAERARGRYVYSPRWDYVRTGELRLHILWSHSGDPLKTWKDGAKSRPEDHVNAVLQALLDAALRAKTQREERRLAELERQRKEKLRWELSARRAANATLVQELEAQAGAWLRARFLRSYVRALRKSLGTQTIEAMRQGTPVNFVDWAQHYVDQLDPLCATPHDPDFQEERSSYSSTDAKINETLSRLLGRQWQSAFKVGQRVEPEPKATPGEIVLGRAHQGTSLAQRDPQPSDMPGDA